MRFTNTKYNDFLKIIVSSQILSKMAYNCH